MHTGERSNNKGYELESNGMDITYPNISNGKNDFYPQKS